MTRNTTVGLLISLAVSIAAAPVEAKHVRFLGMHPIPDGQGGGFCYIEGPHVHIYDPARPDVLYRTEPDGYAFVGDPVPYGYDGPKYSYYGHHPVYTPYGDEEYCYLDGPHYHYFSPPAEGRFKLKAGVHFYTGHFPSVYVDAKPRYSKINVIYRPLRYTRPVVVEAPPPEYTGPVYVEDRPTVVVPAQRPSVQAGAGVYGGVGMTAGFSVQVGTPPPVIVEERPAVIVHERPVVVHERPVYVRERPVIIHDERPRVIKIKGDRGKHKGWRKWRDHDD